MGIDLWQVNAPENFLLTTRSQFVHTRREDAAFDLRPPNSAMEMSTYGQQPWRDFAERVFVLGLEFSFDTGVPLSQGRPPVN
jgi:hypothetical protein